jgi:hypothetical protein
MGSEWMGLCTFLVFLMIDQNDHNDVGGALF